MLFYKTIEAKRFLNENIINSLADECQREELEEYLKGNYTLVLLNKYAVSKRMVNDFLEKGPFTREWNSLERILEKKLKKLINKNEWFIITPIMIDRYIIGVIKDNPFVCNQ